MILISKSTYRADMYIISNSESTLQTPETTEKDRDRFSGQPRGGGLKASNLHAII